MERLCGIDLCVGNRNERPFMGQEGLPVEDEGSGQTILEIEVRGKRGSATARA
jgi:hypothetical protein